MPKLGHMTTQPTAGHVPSWTIGDRLRKAREDAGFDQRELAEKIGVSRNSVSNYEVGVVPNPRPIVLNAWSMATGVPVSWLRGEHPDNGPRTPGTVEPAGYTGITGLRLVA